jgi:hypothetical protein
MASSTSWAGITFSVPGTCWGMKRPFSSLPHSNLHRVDGFHVAVLIALKLGGGGQVGAGIAAEHGGGFFLAVVHAVDLRPFGPGVTISAGFRRLGHNFQLGNAGAAVANGGADAVCARVAAADDHHILTSSGDVVVSHLAVQHRLGVLGQELHGEVDALQIAAFDGQVAGTGGAGAEDHRVEVLHQGFGGYVFAHFGVADEGDALGFQHVQPPLDDFLLVQLHVGDAVHQQPTGAVGPFIHRHPVASGVELGGSGEPGGTGADDGHFLAGALAGRGGADPAGFPALFGDGILNVFDGHGGTGDAQHAGSLAGGGANPSGEFGEVVGLVESLQGFLPQAPVDQVVPFGNQVVDGATAGHATDGHPRVAEGGAAVHTAGSLGLEPVVGHMQVELVPVADAIGRGDFFATSRRYSIKPVGFPMVVVLKLMV